MHTKLLLSPRAHPPARRRFGLVEGIYSGDRNVKNALFIFPVSSRETAAREEPDEKKKKY